MFKQNDVHRYITEWNNKKILFVMATHAEFGEHMQSTGINPLITGIGLINAASKLASTLAILDYLGHQPNIIINIGTAGVQDLPINTIYEITQIRNADMDASALGIEEGKTPLGFYPGKITIPQRFGLDGAECYSTTRYNAFIPSKGHARELEDMEFAAIIDVCNHYNIPAVGLKGVSNNKETIHSSINSWEEYCTIIDKRFAHLINEIKDKIINTCIQDDLLLAMPLEWHNVQYTFRAQQGNAQKALVLLDALGDD